MKKLTAPATVLVATLALAPGVAAHAEDASPPAPTTASWTTDGTLADLVAKATPFVSLREETFVVDEASARAALTTREMSQVAQLVASANRAVAALDIDPSAPAPSPVSDRHGAPRSLAFSDGITQVEAHWYGFRVWLSKSTLRDLGGGVGLGALWIPEPIVSKVLASLGGAVAAFAPGGVVFNYTPVFTLSSPLGTFWGQEWQ